MDKSKIEWTDATWNPVRGCSRVSKGCEHCYAEGIARRFKGPGQNYDGLIGKTGKWNGKTRFIQSALFLPLKWRKPRMIFVNSMSDLFHESISYADIDRVFAVMLFAYWHTFQILTKRSARMRAYCSDRGMPRRVVEAAVKMIGSDEQAKAWFYKNCPKDKDPQITGILYLPNVWLGVSAEDQPTFDERVEDLKRTPAAIRFLSIEPQIGPIDPCEAFGVWWNQTMRCFEASGARFDPRIDWVINGGESGGGARPMHPDWACRWRDICAALEIPYFFKQWGAWVTEDQSPLDAILPSRSFMPWAKPNKEGEYVLGDRTEVWKVGKKMAGRLLDGVEHNAFPEVNR